MQVTIDDMVAEKQAELARYGALQRKVEAE